jgi:sulfate adenylyltransferase subunit 1 (EFTu-like GTPase family)
VGLRDANEIGDYLAKLLDSVQVKIARESQSILKPVQGVSRVYQEALSFTTKQTLEKIKTRDELMQYLKQQLEPFVERIRHAKDSATARAMAQAFLVKIKYSLFLKITPIVLKKATVKSFSVIK